MKLHDQFEWDPRKAKINLAKHHVTFEYAAEVLGDDDGDFNHVEEYDDAHSMSEDRYNTYGSHPDNRRIILRITWTDRTQGRLKITHIISARPATPRERKSYAKEISS